jgi:hypothetical protein
MSTQWTGMPKTAINKDCDFMFGKYEVWFSDNLGGMHMPP